MPELVSSEALVLFANASVFASLVVLPALVAGYARYKLRVRRIAADFSLGKLESVELDRAVLLYKWVSERQQEIQRQCAQVSGTWFARYRQRRSLRRQFAEERYQLSAFASHLRSTIIRLRRRPIYRFRSWVRVASWHLTLGSSLVLYLAAWAALIAIYQPDQPSWQDVTTELDGLLLWEPVDVRMLFGNLLAASLVLAAMPMLYGMSRVTIRSHHALQLRDLREFAAMEPDVLISRLDANEDLLDGQGGEIYEASPVTAEEAAWFEILGVSPSANLDEIKQAYKMLVKQNHPDRVHGMSPQFQELAERETRKLNAAYEEAAALVRQEIGSAGIQRSEPVQA